jgi:hypothetical protein
MSKLMLGVEAFSSVAFDPTRVYTASSVDRKPRQELIRAIALVRGDADRLQSEVFTRSFQHLTGRNDFSAEVCWVAMTPQ